MLYDAKNGTVSMGGTDMDYIVFGNGSSNLVMLPGLGDGLKTVRGTALPFSVGYREYCRDFRVWVFSRKNKLPKKYSAKEMADDQKEAMDKLGIRKAHILGVSQGGTIAQQLAVNHPECVDKLVLAVTFSKQNDTVQNAVGGWIEWAKKGDYASIMTDTAERSYSEAYLKKYRPLYPVLTRIGKPASFDRFITMAEAVVEYDGYDRLGEITAPTLIIGGNDDRIVTPEASHEMAAAIKNSTLHMYEGYGHAAYEEAGDFNRRVIDFMLS